MKPYGRAKHDGYNTEPYIKAARAVEKGISRDEIQDQLEMGMPGKCDGWGCPFWRKRPGEMCE